MTKGPGASTGSAALPTGQPLPDWHPPPRPPRDILSGRCCCIEPLDADAHACDLHAANRLDTDASGWTYLPYGPFASESDYREWVARQSAIEDPMFFAIVDAVDGLAIGVASWLRIDPGAGSIEVGHIRYSPLLQRRPAATEAMYLMMRRAFELGYRRYEWKCDALNAPSCRAAERFGFIHEGTFRQATIYKGRNRDTAWYSIIDGEWPALRAGYERWLDPSNFDAQGVQRMTLEQARCTGGASV